MYSLFPLSGGQTSDGTGVKHLARNTGLNLIKSFLSHAQIPIGVCAAMVFFFIAQLVSAQAEHAQTKATLCKLLEQLSPYEKAAQVLMVSISGNKTADKYAISLFKGLTPGAVLLFGYNIAETHQAVEGFLRSTTKGFEDEAVRLGRHFLPPLYATDNEGGSVYRTRGITAPLASAEKIGKSFSAHETEELYQLLALQMKELGLHLNLAPIAEVSLPETKAILGTRTFSTDVTLAGSYAAAAVRGMQKAGILAAVKHFPGNGTGDLHQEASVLSADYRTLLSRYCAAFQPAITDGAAAVLVSHIIIPTIEAVPFCFSAKGIALLRNTLLFSGLIITDDIAMQSLTQEGQSPEHNATRAIAAGCDMIMCSLPKYYALITAIAERATADKIFAKRLDEAVQHVLTAKYKARLLNPHTSIDSDDFYVPHTPNWKQFQQAKEAATAYRGKRR